MQLIYKNTECCLTLQYLNRILKCHVCRNEIKMTIIMSRLTEHKRCILIFKLYTKDGELFTCNVPVFYIK